MTSVYLWRKQICKLLLKKAGVFTRFFFPAELIGIHTNTCSHMLKKKMHAMQHPAHAREYKTTDTVHTCVNINAINIVS